jgi:hypothetical protein
MATSSTAAPGTTTPSRPINCRLQASGRIAAATPRMSSRLAMLLPTMVPMAIAGAPPSEAARLVTNSGAEVPKATTVSPMISGDMPASRASPTAPRTRKSANTSSMTSPAATLTSARKSMTASGRDLLARKARNEPHAGKLASRRPRFKMALRRGAVAWLTRPGLLTLIETSRRREIRIR